MPIQFAPYCRCIALSWLALALAATVSAAAPTAAGGDSASVAKLTRLSDDWDKAIISKDRAAIADNMAEDFRQIASDASVQNKAAFVADLVAPDFGIDPYNVEDFDVRVYGDVALLSGTIRMTGHSEGKPFASHFRYIDIYVHKGERWKIVSVQISKFKS
jgi:ketosteroid isomerase-like protein